jgi:hypothetical protein
LGGYSRKTLPHSEIDKGVKEDKKIHSKGYTIDKLLYPKEGNGIHNIVKSRIAQMKVLIQS